MSLLFLAVTSLYWFKKSDFISDRIESLAKKSLEPILRQQVTIEKSELALFPPSAVITGIRSSGKLPVSIKKVQISFSLWSLLTQSFFIQEILIENPTFSFGPDADIHLGDQKNKVVIRRIRVTEGTVSYNAYQQAVFIPHLNITIAPNFKMDRFNIALSGKQGRVLFAKQEKSLDQLEGVFVVHPKGIDVTRISAQLGKSELAIEGTLLFPGVMPPALVMPTAKGSNIGLNMRMTATVPIEEVLPVSESRPNLLGKMIIQGRVAGTLLKPTVNGKIAIPRLFLKGGEVGSIGSDFSYQNNKGSFKNILAKIFSGEVRGEAAIEKESYRLALRYNHFSMDQSVTAFSSYEQGRHFYGLFSKGEINLSGKGMGQEQVTGSGLFEIKREAVAKDMVMPVQGVPFLQLAEVFKSANAPIRIFSLVTEGNMVWTKSEEGIRIHEGTLAFPEGKATLEGLYAPDKGLSFTTSLEMEQIKAASDLIRIPMTGRVRFSGTLSGALSRPSMVGTLKLNDWTFNQHPFGSFQSQLQYQDKTLTFLEGSLHGQRALRGDRPDRGLPPPDAKGHDPIYKFGGTFRLAQSPRPLAYDFIADATAVDPQEILTFFGQKIPLFTTATGKISINGIGNKFTVTGPVTMGEGSLYGERFTNGRVLLTINEKEVRLRNALLERGGTASSESKMSAEGSGEISYQGDYMLDVKTSKVLLQKLYLLGSFQPDLLGEMTLTVNGKGNFKHPELKMTASLENLQYKEASMESGTVHVNWQDENVMILGSFPKKNFSLTAEVGAKKPHPFSFKVHSASLPIHPFFPKKWLLTSGFSTVSLYAGGDISGKGTFDTVQQSDLTGDLSTLSATWGDYWLTNDGPITFNAQKGNVLIEKGSFKGINTDLTLSGRVAPLKNWGLIVKGTADMNLLRLFTPKIRSGKGVAQVDVRITDQWENPNIQGVLSMKSGLLSLTNFSDPISISALSLVFNRNLLILETISGRMGRGQFTGFGKAALKGVDLNSFGFQFDLKEMPIRLTPDVETIMEGSLLFQGDKKAQLLDGSLHVQKALYEKRIDLREMIVKWQESQEERLPIDIPFSGTTRLSIHLSGKENIAVRNNIAKVPLALDLFLKGTLENPLLFGQVDVPRGTFSFRANEFKVTSGMVQFVNPEKIDPLFDIKGQSKIRDYAIELSLTGTLSRFVLGLTALPPLPSDDILSLLALGKTTAEVVEAGGVATSIVSDFVAGFLAEPIQQFTGLDKITVGVPDGKSSKSTLISLEKRVLKDKLLVVYSDTLDPAEEPKVKIYYDLGKNVSLVGEKDEQGKIGGDIRFRFEFR